MPGQAKYSEPEREQMRTELLAYLAEHRSATCTEVEGAGFGTHLHTIYHGSINTARKEVGIRPRRNKLPESVWRQRKSHLFRYLRENPGASYGDVVNVGYLTTLNRFFDGDVNSAYRAAGIERLPKANAPRAAKEKKPARTYRNHGLKSQRIEELGGYARELGSERLIGLVQELERSGKVSLAAYPREMEVLGAAFSELDDRRKAVLSGYFGLSINNGNLEMGEPQSLAKLRENLGGSRWRLDQIKFSAIKSMRLAYERQLC